MSVRVEDDGHDVPGRAELWRRHVPAEFPQQVPLVLGDAVVDLDVVVGAVCVELQLEVMEGQQHRGALRHHNQPRTLHVIRVQTREIRAGYVPAGRREDPPTFDSCRVDK